MRLSNEVDQEIIRKAIPGSSVSALNFISSLANGEAIAFGEALPVPMRLKFNRVSEDALPRAHGAEVRDAVEDPSTLNLGNVIERMRQTSAPDISDFRSRVSAAEANIHEAVFATSGQFEDDETVFAPSLAPEPGANLEPYNPGMLPGVARAVSAEQDPRLNNRFDRYDALFKTSAPSSQPPRPAPEEGGAHHAGQSLRERLLARAPGSNLIRR